MSMEFIRKSYRVPAEVGGRVEYTGGGEPKRGTITGTCGPHLMIRMDGDKASLNYHPTWELRYLQDGAEGQ